jgi:hypothetical protein
VQQITTFATQLYPLYSGSNSNSITILYINTLLSGAVPQQAANATAQLYQ